MIDDFKPVKRPAKSLQENKNQLQDQPAPEPNFETPAEAAAQDDLTEPALIATAPEPTTKKSRLNWREIVDFHWPPGKKEYITIAVAVVLLVITGLLFSLLRPHPAAAPVAASKPAPKKIVKPVVITSNLTGLPITDAKLNEQPVTGVMIENSLDARPQSGLGQAGVVFEAIAEGGITRFLALFQDTSPANVGPVRSARPYYVQWALGYDAGYAHVGGSPEALANIKAWGVRDLDQFYNAGAYRRTSDRVAPHNVYTSIDALKQLQANKGFGASKFTGFSRKAEAASKQPTASKIDLALSGPLYNVHYDYNQATNSYNRNEGGAIHADTNTNAQISPKVVVALVTPYSIAADGYHSEYGSIGTGAAYIFQDGTVTIGQWSKPANNAPLSLLDSAGKPFAINAGQTWLTAVSSTAKIASTP